MGTSRKSTRDCDPTALRPPLLELLTHGRGAPHRTHCSRRMKRGAAPDRTTPRASGPGPCRVAPIAVLSSTGPRRRADPARARSDRRRGRGGRGTRRACLRSPRERCRAPRTDVDRPLEVPGRARIPEPSGSRSRVHPPRPSRPAAWETSRTTPRSPAGPTTPAAARGGQPRWPGPGFR